MKSKLLSDLKKTLSVERAAPAPVTPAAPPRPADEGLDDATLFARATAGARKLKLEPVVDTRTPPSRWDENIVARRAAAEGAAEVPDEALSDTVAFLNPVAPEAILSFRRTGIQQGLFKKLKDGQLLWKAAVDLHGCTVEEARQAVLEIIHDAQQEGLQIVKIVHGKGFGQTPQSGLLKTCVNGWLQQHRGVLAFHSAPAKDGGNGAVLVLLKKLAPPERAPDDKRG